MTIETKIKACIERHPEWDDRHVSRGVRGATMAMARAVREGKPVDEPTPEPMSTTGIITLESVRARYDIVAAIRREIARLKPGALILESEMRLRSAGKDAARFRRAVENNDEFKANRIRLKLDPDGGEGQWYWADISTVSAAVRVRDSV